MNDDSNTKNIETNIMVLAGAVGLANAAWSLVSGALSASPWHVFTPCVVACVAIEAFALACGKIRGKF